MGLVFVFNQKEVCDNTVTTINDRYHARTWFFRCTHKSYILAVRDLARYTKRSPDVLGYKFVRYADGFLVFCKTEHQAEEALEAVAQCIEEDLGLSLSGEKTHITIFGRGFNFLGFYVAAFTIRMGEKAEERFKTKIKAITRRSHKLDAEVVVKLNRVIRVTVRYFAASFTTGLGRFNALDHFIRRRIRCMKYTRI